MEHVHAEGGNPSTMKAAPSVSSSSLDTESGDGNVLLNNIEDHRWDEATSRTNTEEGREELRREIYNGMLPLHRACWNGNTPSELVEAMLEGYKEAARVTDNYGRLPLHCACENSHPSPRVVRLLLDAHPEGAKIADFNGQLPLHQAVNNDKKTPLEILKMIINAHPEAVTTCDNQGRLPVHRLVEEASPDKEEDVEKVNLLLIRPLLKDEEACRMAGGWCRMLPLHIAAKFDLSMDIFRALLSTYGDAAKEKCKRRWNDDERTVYALDLLEEQRNRICAVPHESTSDVSAESLNRQQGEATTEAPVANWGGGNRRADGPVDGALTMFERSQRRGTVRSTDEEAIEDHHREIAGGVVDSDVVGVHDAAGTSSTASHLARALAAVSSVVDGWWSKTRTRANRTTAAREGGEEECIHRGNEAYDRDLPDTDRHECDGMERGSSQVGRVSNAASSVSVESHEPCVLSGGEAAASTLDSVHVAHSNSAVEVTGQNSAATPFDQRRSDSGVDEDCYFDAAESMEEGRCGAVTDGDVVSFTETSDLPSSCNQFFLNSQKDDTRLQRFDDLISPEARERNMGEHEGVISQHLERGGATTAVAANAGGENELRGDAPVDELVAVVSPLQQACTVRPTEEKREDDQGAIGHGAGFAAGSASNASMHFAAGFFGCGWQAHSDRTSMTAPSYCEDLPSPTRSSRLTDAGGAGTRISDRQPLGEAVFPCITEPIQQQPRHSDQPQRQWHHSEELLTRKYPNVAARWTNSADDDGTLKVADDNGTLKVDDDDADEPLPNKETADSLLSDAAVLDDCRTAAARTLDSAGIATHQGSFDAIFVATSRMLVDQTNSERESSVNDETRSERDSLIDSETSSENDSSSNSVASSEHDSANEFSLWARASLAVNRNDNTTDDNVVAFNEKSDLLFAYNPNILPYRKDNERLQRFVEQISVGARERNLSEPARRVWLWMCTFTNEEDPEDNYVSQINTILGGLGDRKLVEWLASFETPHVRQILIRDIASPTCAKAINSHFLFAGRLELNRDPPMHKSATCIVVDAKDFGDPYDRAHEEHRGSDLNEFKRVVVKFMSNADQFKREIESRNLHASTRCSQPTEQPFLVPCVTYFDGGKKQSTADAHYERDIQESADVFGHDLLFYPYAIVMQRADRNFDSIYRHEVPSMLKIRGYMEEVAHVLKDLHDTGKIHADIKLLNIVRVNDLLTLIDMDSHRRINVDHCGVKLSTGILPPEMFYELKSDEEKQVELYWEDVLKDFNTIEQIKRDTNAEVPDAISDNLAKGRGVENDDCESRLRFYAEQSPTVNRLLSTPSFSVSTFNEVWSRLRKNEALWKKVRPRVSKAGQIFVPRAFREGGSAALPYDLVPANATIDVWSFGVLLYKLCTKSDLFESNDTTGDLRHGEAYFELACWDVKEPTCKKKIDAVENEVARDLLTSLLAKDPTERPKTMTDVLNHDFFRADYSAAKGKLEMEIAAFNAKLKELSDVSNNAASRRESLEKATKVKKLEELLKEKEEELKTWTYSFDTLVDSSNWNVLIKRVTKAPDALPKNILHSVCKRGATLAVIDAIIQAKSDLVKGCNGLEELPIHVACRYGAELRVIERFVRLHPTSISKVTELDKTPLDNAQNSEWTHCSSDQIKVVKFLRQQVHKDYFDDMTGLPRTAGLKIWAPLPPPGIQKADAKVFVLNIDISGFKAVNDNTKDHKIGDDAIRKYAKSIEDTCEKYVKSAKKRSMHIVLDVFRPGGDEFVVAGKFEKSCMVEAVWTNMIKPLIETLGDLTFDDKKKPCRYCTFLRIGCCTGNLDRMGDILEEADKLQGEIKEAIGLERGGFISLKDLRGKGISNFSEQYVELT